MSDTEKPTPPKGLEGVVAATTKLSSVRGLDGELIYRGYNINELAGNATYEESRASAASRQVAERRGTGLVEG